MIFPEVNRYAVVSTGMMTHADMHKMKFDAKGLDPEGPIIIDYEIGFFVYAWHEDEITDNFKKYSPQVQQIMEEAHKQGITYVMFDRDGPKIEGLNVYDW
jgi:hypothetical protein